MSSLIVKYVHAQELSAQQEDVHQTVEDVGGTIRIRVVTAEHVSSRQCGVGVIDLVNIRCSVPGSRGQMEFLVRIAVVVVALR